MRAIWKFQFEIKDEFSIDMPEGARILYVDVQKDQPSIWALVSPVQTTESRHFRVLGTGHPFDFSLLDFPYVGTFQMHGGDLVFHLFG